MLSSLHMRDPIKDDINGARSHGIDTTSVYSVETYSVTQTEGGI